MKENQKNKNRNLQGFGEICKDMERYGVFAVFKVFFNACYGFLQLTHYVFIMNKWAVESYNEREILMFTAVQAA